ncbi:hypothetical protein CJ739_1205 [Mariniflexile rhizosphaerae]|uniref:DUF4301 family protein n=1 Tax=unclassified Mariniflexile TaxID=2643887 RepID=UPI000CB53FD5|nr:DUF4301 family protein [Mariniflexile sp. TRM1-10]AXP80296.1 hypothetical protein CJ739_1205 [Mariniflexile sp. TRM1-10]PLB17967.1 MAG: Ribosylnicotinamide kinase [Flavobacteriaceae bacterium FS1-H7996/R]
MFSDKDIQQIISHGLTVEKVSNQIEIIKSGMIYSNLVEAATIGNGILRIDAEKQQDYIDRFESNRNQLSIVKFVPASGAATRMFKFLFQFLDNYKSEDPIELYAQKNNAVSVFLSGLEKFPFYETVREKLVQTTPNFNSLTFGEQCVLFVKMMLDTDQLNYSFYPKGLLPFHKYKNDVSTAFKEHLIEATIYASSNNQANLHFTISEAHKAMFEKELKLVKESLETETNTKFNVSFSYQDKSTDTIAITSSDKLYRTEDDKLLFRPSGHGALIENLNTLDFDFIFIKNIDNIVVLEQNIEVSNYKKMLAGILLQIQTQTFKYLNKLEDDEISEDEVNNIELFVINRINVEIEEAYTAYTLKEKRDYLHHKLNRPIRVCGMVKNEGEPGGGPFWVKDSNGAVSLQIVEFAQIDIENQSQKSIVDNATHFNPTDLVCAVKDYKGNKFDLTKYVDPDAAFITLKSQNGVDIKALELPGLWNGSMSHWNSIFVEIPVSTFNPVKTVNDLLKPAHQV